MFVYAARQPIFNEDKSLFAYELLFRDSLNNVFPGISSVEATSRLMANHQFSSGLDAITAGSPAFVNFDLASINAKLYELMPTETLVVEILETETPDDELLAHCKALKEKGYKLALDDYIHSNEWRKFYPYVDVIKMDLRETSREEIEKVFNFTRFFKHIEMLAEKVETYEEFEWAKKLGFKYFQGYFFAKPEVVQKKAVSSMHTNVLGLLKETSASTLDMEAISEIVNRDAGLTYKFLRYANSSIYNRSSKIENVKQAVVSLGEEEVKKLVSLISASQLAEAKPSELLLESLSRARFCETLSAHIKFKVDASSAFLTGLISLIDALLDLTLEEALEKLPLEAAIKEALLSKKGAFALLLKVHKLYETGEWKKLDAVCEKYSINLEKVGECYNEANLWSSNIMQFE